MDQQLKQKQQITKLLSLVMCLKLSTLPLKFAPTQQHRYLALLSKLRIIVQRLDRRMNRVRILKRGSIVRKKMHGDVTFIVGYSKKYKLTTYVYMHYSSQMRDMRMI